MGVRISDLPEAAAVQRTDVIIISGEETKKMTYASLLTQLKADLNIGSSGGSANVITRTWRGLPIRIVSDGINVTVSITGHANASITTNNAWTTVGDFSADGLKPQAEVMGYQIVNAVHALRFRWGTDGVFQIGWGRNTASGAAINIASGNVVNMQFTFSLK